MYNPNTFEFQKYSFGPGQKRVHSRVSGLHILSMLGDLVSYGGEEGVICHEDPLIMRCVAFHSYVPVQGTPVVLQVGYEPDATMRDEVVRRICNYLGRPTGSC